MTAKEPAIRPLNGPAASPRRFSIVLAAAAIAAAAAGGAFAADSGLALSGAYMRTIIPSRPAAGYFSLANTGTGDRVLVGASSPGCGMLMLHKSETVNGVDQMVHVDSIPVPAGGSVTFAPAGYHLMCMKPTAAVKPGGTVPVTLTFKDGGTLTGDFPVRGPGGK